MICELREVFPVLEGSDGGGLGITAVQPGFAVSGVANAVPAMSFQDVSGNLVFPQLNSLGQLPVTLQGAGAPIRARGQLDCGNATSGVILVTGAQIVLVSGASYSPVSMVVSCFRETLAQLVWNDNGTDNILEDVLLGPGQYTCQLSLPSDSFMAGSGSQTLEVRARNTTAYPSAIRASVVVNEIL